MQVKATAKGYYGSKLREAGETFTIASPDDFSADWMESLDPSFKPRERERRPAPAKTGAATVPADEHARAVFRIKELEALLMEERENSVRIRSEAASRIKELEAKLAAVPKAESQATGVGKPDNPPAEPKGKPAKAQAN